MLLKFHAETKKNQKSKRQQNSLPTSTSLTTMVTRFLHQMTVLGICFLIPLTNPSVQNLRYFCIKDKGYHVSVWPKDQGFQGRLHQFNIAGITHGEHVDDHLVSSLPPWNPTQPTPTTRTPQDSHREGPPCRLRPLKTKPPTSVTSPLSPPLLTVISAQTTACISLIVILKRIKMNANVLHHFRQTQNHHKQRIIPQSPTPPESLKIGEDDADEGDILFVYRGFGLLEGRFWYFGIFSDFLGFLPPNVLHVLQFYYVLHSTQKVRR